MNEISATKQIDIARKYAGLRRKYWRLMLIGLALAAALFATRALVGDAAVMTSFAVCSRFRS
jgi:hypothetical protein